MNAVDLAGFANPVPDAQRCFRAVLDAMARPGLVCPAGTGLVAPAGLDPATAAVLLTLIDGETALWLDPVFNAARDWVAFHCGVTPVADPAAAVFVVTPRLPDLGALEAGSHEAPENGATVIVQITAFGTGARYLLRGPGLRVPTVLAVTGLPPDFAAIWQANRAGFPRGVDLVLCAGTRLAALPRSVTIEEA